MKRLAEDYAALTRRGFVTRTLRSGRPVEVWRTTMREKARADRLTVRTYTMRARRTGFVLVMADLPGWKLTDADLAEVAAALDPSRARS